MRADEFSHPEGLALSRGRLIVADKDNNRLVCLHADTLAWAFATGRFGSGPSELMCTPRTPPPHAPPPHAPPPHAAHRSTSRRRLSARHTAARATPQHAPHGSTRNTAARCGTGSARTQLKLPSADQERVHVPVADPTSVAITAGGEIVCADHYNNRLQVFGLSSGVWLRSICGFGAASGPGRLAYPYGVGIDAKGRFLVTETKRLIVLTPEGEQVQSLPLPERGALSGVQCGPRQMAFLADSSGDSVLVHETLP